MAEAPVLLLVHLAAPVFGQRFENAMLLVSDGENEDYFGSSLAISSDFLYTILWYQDDLGNLPRWVGDRHDGKEGDTSRGVKQ